MMHGQKNIKLIYRAYVETSEDSCILGYDAALSGKYRVAQKKSYHFISPLKL